MRKTRKRAGRALGAALLAGSLGACDFISGVPDNTNLLVDAQAAQLFTSIQVNAIFFNEGQLSRLTAMWLNQIAGTDRQFAILDQYVIDEEDVDFEMAAMYGAGGLQDIKLASEKAVAAGHTRFAAILKVHEAFLFGMGASLWGDIPYSGAGDPTTDAPLDAQESVYAAVQTLLDQAIAELPTAADAGEAGILAQRDMNFGGDPGAWQRVAQSLKARFYMHWVEAQAAGGAAATAANTACAGNCLTKAVAAAQAGINTAGGNWVGVHSSTSTETNLWYQFTIDRSGYTSGGELGVSVLRDRGDPRLPLYYTTASTGAYQGSRPGSSSGDLGPSSSQLNTGAGGYAAPAADLPFITCAETRFILAEAFFRQGNTASAQSNLREGVRCHLQQLGLPAADANVNALLPSPLPGGAALLAEIIRQKYIALFLNMEAFNDYKRTCLPDIRTVKAGTSIEGEPVPGRFYYGQTERQTNSNIPEPAAQPLFNRNDPAPCPAT